MAFQVGDKVFLRSKNIRTLRPHKKLDHRQLGPFTIIDAWGKQAYKLNLPPRYGRLHPVFHVSLLEPCHQRGDKSPSPIAFEIDGETEYAIESILSKRGKQGKIEYLVRWKNCPPSEDSWEPAHALEETEALDIFEAEQKDKPPPPSRKRQRTGIGQ